MIKIRNIFKRKRKEEKTTTREEYASVFSSLDGLEKSGMISYDRRLHRLFIEQPIARVMLDQGEKGWLCFLQNCFLWLSYRLYGEAWDKLFLTEELKAVRRARKRFANLTAADIDRIKRARRAELQMSDLEPPRIDGFEFFVVRETTDTPLPGDTNAVSGGEILLAGVYNADDDMWKASPWSDIQDFVK